METGGETGDVFEGLGLGMSVIGSEYIGFRSEICILLVSWRIMDDVIVSLLYLTACFGGTSA